MWANKYVFLQITRRLFRNEWQVFFFFFNDTATTEIYTLSLHDALPISLPLGVRPPRPRACRCLPRSGTNHRDRKSTRLNSSHDQISYAVFCLKKKKNKTYNQPILLP